MEIDLRNLPKITNSVYYPLYRDESRYLILYGGAGSGKSVYAAQKTIFRIITEQNHKVLIVRKVGTTLRDSVFALIKQTLVTFGLYDYCDINKTDMTITIPMLNSEILFKSIDDPEKIKSVHGVTMMWLEECSEFTQEDFQQLDLRLRGFTKHYKQLMLSFNPISATHWLKEMFFDKGMPSSTVVHTTYKQNDFIDDQYKQTLENLKDQDEYYYTIYCLGEWGVLGKTIFNARLVSERIATIRHIPPLKRGLFVFEKDAKGKPIDDTIQWVEDSTGYVRVFKEPLPNYPYVIGGDTAGEGSDHFTGHVINNVTGEQVAVLDHELDDDVYVEQIYCMGKHYNFAFVGIEVNFNGGYTVKQLQKWNYSRMYVRQKVDDYTDGTLKKYGFLTGGTTRPFIISKLVNVVNTNVSLINDIDTLNEMLTFIRNPKKGGRIEAAEGKHDDHIMGLAIAHYIRDQFEQHVIEEETKKPVPLPFRSKDDIQEGAYVEW